MTSTRFIDVYSSLVHVCMDHFFKQVVPSTLHCIRLRTWHGHPVTGCYTLSNGPCKVRPTIDQTTRSPFPTPHRTRQVCRYFLSFFSTMIVTKIFYISFKGLRFRRANCERCNVTAFMGRDTPQGTNKFRVWIWKWLNRIKRSQRYNADSRWQSRRVAYHTLKSTHKWLTGTLYCTLQ